MVVSPAAAHHGICFKRTDISGPNAYVEARWDLVTPSKLCTMLENTAGVRVSTVEHVMAALAGCAVNNALIEIDSEEVPILDGSSMPFVKAFWRQGIQEQAAPLQAIRILKTVEVNENGCTARLEPADMLEIDFHIRFDDEAIGNQKKRLNLANGAFVRELSDSRTFCWQADVDHMRAHGLARGGTMENAVVFSGPHVLSPGGLRHADEPVRHKMLDAVGDLYLAGAPIIGRYTGFKAGHALTNRLLRALFATDQSWDLIECNPGMQHNLPGVGLSNSDFPLAS